MTDEAHHIARQAAALDDPRLCRDSGGVTDAQDEAPDPLAVTREHLHAEIDEALKRLQADDSLRKDLLQFVEYWQVIDAYSVPDHVVGTVRNMVYWLLVRAARGVRADLARPSQAGDERVAGLLDTQIAAQDIIIKRQEAENARLREALWRLLREAEMDGMESRAGWDCWMHHARAALAAMDTPKGGGDE